MRQFFASARRDTLGATATENSLIAAIGGMLVIGTFGFEIPRPAAFLTAQAHGRDQPRSRGQLIMENPIIGFVVSNQAGDYDTDAIHPREEAERIVRRRNARLNEAERCHSGSWDLGAVFANGEVDFSCC